MTTKATSQVSKAKTSRAKTPKKASSSKKASSKKSPAKKLTGIQRLRRRKLRHLDKHHQTTLSDRDLHLMFNEHGLPGGVKIEGKIDVKRYTAEEGWDAGFYIWKIGQDWKFTLENHPEGGLEFIDISDQAPQDLTRHFTNQEFTGWLSNFFHLNSSVSLSITPNGKLLVIPLDSNHSSIPQVKQLADQLLKDLQITLDHQQLRDLIIHTCLPTNQSVKPDELQITTIVKPSRSAIRFTWPHHRVTLTRPAWGGVKALHHRHNQVIEDQFSGAYFFNWLSQVLQVPGDLFAEVTDDGHLSVQKR
jgi:hypothetical protein